MNNTVTSPQPDGSRPAYATMSSSLDVGAKWYAHIGRVVVGDVDHVLSIQLSPDQAAKLAADLIEAVAKSGAGEVPDVLLDAFGVRPAPVELRQAFADGVKVGHEEATEVPR